MVTQSLDDGEGELLARICRIAPALPTGVALDMHTNLSARMIAHATVIAGYHTYPHIDIHETGMRAGKAILARLAGKAQPAMAWAWRAAGATNCSTWHGSRAGISSTRSSPFRVRSRAPASSTQARWCCSIATTTPPRAGPWTAWLCPAAFCQADLGRALAQPRADGPWRAV